MKVGINVLVYMGSSLLAGAVPLLLMPVMTHHLSEADYGAFAMVTTLAAIMTPALNWGTTALSGVDFFKRSAAEFPESFSSGLLLPVMSLAVLMTLILLFGQSVGAALEIPAWWLSLGAILAILSLPPLYVSSLMRARNEPYKFAALEVSTAVSTVVLALMFIVQLKMDWLGRVYATALTSLALSAFAAWWLRRHGYLLFRANRERTREAFQFGAGVIAHDIGGQVIRYGDRLLLGALLGLASTGQYAVAASIAGVMLVVVAAFNRAWSPFLFSRLSRGGGADHREIVKMTYLAAGGFLVLFLVFNAATPLLYALFVDEKFNESMAYVRWLTLGYFFAGVYATYVDYIFYMKRTRYLSVTTAVNLMCNLGLNYVLVKAFGTVGAAYAFAATMCLVMCLAFVIVNRLHPMPWLYWLSSKPEAHSG